MTSNEESHPGPAARHHRPAKGLRGRVRDRIRRNWRSSLKTVGGSEKVRKKLLTVLLYFLLCVVMAAVFVGVEYQYDRQSRIRYKEKLHEYVKEISEFSKVMDVVEWRYYAKAKINEIVQMNYDWNIGPNYRVEAWNFANAFVFILSTTTTIGYGHPAPNTTAGRIITIVLCITGIPFAYMALTDFVDLILVIEKFIWLMVRKKGAKPLSAFALYKNMVTRHLSQMRLVRHGRQQRYSAPELDRPTEVTEHSPQVSTNSKLLTDQSSSSASTKTPHVRPPRVIIPYDEIFPDEATGLKTPSINASRSGHMPASVHPSKHKDEDGHVEDLEDPNKQHSTIIIQHHELTCCQKIFACLYENCCEEPPVEEEEEEEYHVEDHLGEGHPSPLPGEDALHHMKITTGTVRREIDTGEIKQQSNHVVDGHIHSHAGRTGTKTGISGETIHSLQSTLKKELETMSMQSTLRPDSRRGSGRRDSIGSSTTETAPSHERLPAELRLPRNLMHRKSTVCGPTAKYSADTYANLDERIQQHRKEQIKMQVAQRHERRITIMKAHKQEKEQEQQQQNQQQQQNEDVPQPPPHMNDAMAFMIEAGSGMIPSHDHSLCNDLLAGTMTSMLEAIISKVKVELEAKEMREAHEASIEELSKSSKEEIGEKLDNIAKEVTRYVVKHDLLRSTSNRPSEPDGAVPGTSQMDSLELPEWTADDGDSDTSLAGSQSGKKTKKQKKRPGTATDDTKNRSNCCAVVSEDELSNENENANVLNTTENPGPNPTASPIIPHVIRTRSRTSGTSSERARRRSMEKMSKVTISTLMEDEEDDDREEVSLAITFLNLLLYIFVGALMFVYGERWDYLTAVYYIFTSISTIGFGDVMPTGGTPLFFWSSLFIFFGLAFLAKVISGIRGAMLKFMLATVTTVEKAGLRIVSNISHLSRNTRRRAIRPHGKDSDGEIHIRTHDMTENALLIPTHSTAQQMMRVQSLPSNLASHSQNAVHEGPSHEFSARMTPAQIGSKPLSPMPPTPIASPSRLENGQLDQTESLNIVCSGSLVNIRDKDELERSRFIMTPMVTDDRSIRSVSAATIKHNSDTATNLGEIPLTPPVEEPSLKQRRLSLLMNSDYITEQLSKDPKSFEVISQDNDNNTSKQKTQKQTVDNKDKTGKPSPTKQGASKQSPSKQGTSKQGTSKQGTSNRPSSAKTSEKVKK